jgi:predicted TIM-barrel enzyme
MSDPPDLAAQPAALLAAAAGTADLAQELADAGVDVVVAYHSSPLRHRGLPSVTGLLPWANANEMTLDLVPGIVVAAAPRPVLATVCANDALRPAPAMVAELARYGVAGVLNAPTVGLLTGPVRRAIEDAGLGFQREIDLMRLARDRGMAAWGYAFTARQARDLVRAGAQTVIAHLGITGTGRGVEQATQTLAAVDRAARNADPTVQVLAHGGPIRDPASFTAVCQLARPPDPGRWGFFGASVFERAGDVRRAVSRWRAVL